MTLRNPCRSVLLASLLLGVACLPAAAGERAAPAGEPGSGISSASALLAVERSITVDGAGRWQVSREETWQNSSDIPIVVARSRGVVEATDFSSVAISGPGASLTFVDPETGTIGYQLELPPLATGSLTLSYSGAPGRWGPDAMLQLSSYVFALSPYLDTACRLSDSAAVTSPTLLSMTFPNRREDPGDLGYEIVAVDMPPGTTFDETATAEAITLTWSAPTGDYLYFRVRWDEGLPCPLIVIPGLGGSVLRDDAGGLLWPAPSTREVRLLSLDADGETPLPGVGVEAHATGTISYDGLLAGLSYRGSPPTGYREVRRGHEVEDLLQTNMAERRAPMWVYPYDWRKDLRGAAVGLSALVSEVEYWLGGGEYWQPRVDLIAHSQGGMVARYYTGVLDTAAAVNKLVTLGTPFLGAPKAYTLLRYGCTASFWLGPLDFYLDYLSPDAITLAAANWAGVYQIMPNGAFFDAYGWIFNDQVSPAAGRLYTPYATYVTNPDSRLDASGTINPTILISARDFHQEIAPGVDCSVLAIAGNLQELIGQTTPGRVTATSAADWLYSFELWLWTDYVRGDGTVPYYSAREIPELTSGGILLTLDVSHSGMLDEPGVHSILRSYLLYDQEP